ncbi:GAF domain-containing protein [Leucobacter tardus]|uniref:Transcriptional regulator n=1 Tax=Leucobacter tardus TaxID=501483 RepID=A0A939QJD5_9MICO|nr:transcriptional regulator [Leucobacter tardus]MBO2988986.1 transcriptional regulator [Leucobacter tardus]
MTTVWQALRPGESPLERRRVIERAHERFISEFAQGPGVFDPPIVERPGTLLPGFSTPDAPRRIVLDSWFRSRGVDPDRGAVHSIVDTDELAELRRTHPLDRVLPVLQRLLFEQASESGFIVAIGDAEGRLLWVDGDPGLRSRAEDMGFRSGADWSERAVGTSAPGSALALDHAIQVLGPEHYSRAVHEWSCTAAPVHDPENGAIIGVVDITGGDAAAAPHLLPLVEATLAAVEAELRIAALTARIEQARSARPAADAAPRTRTPRDPESPAPRLLTLGRHTPVLACVSGTHRLTSRHAEILLALAETPAGLSAAALAEVVYGDRGSAATLRPELLRLRHWLDAHAVGIEISTRPYRLSGALRIDAREMLATLGRGAHRMALASYEGPVVPGSTAPIAIHLRNEVDATLREAMLQSAAVDALFDYAEAWAPDDREVWETLLQILPPHSPRRARAVARLEALESLG